MSISIFDLFSIGIGPSSSHTVGPMRAAKIFATELVERGLLSTIGSVRVDLYGSLGHTGQGHGADKAVLLGLMGETPETVDPDQVRGLLEPVHTQKTLKLLGAHPLPFNPATALRFNKRKRLPLHSNGMRFRAYSTTGDDDTSILYERIYYSIGGGFVVDEEAARENRLSPTANPLPYPFQSGDALLELSSQHQCSISDLMLRNETTWRSEEEVRQNLLHLWSVMKACVQRGCVQEGTLPGGLQVQRRAPQIFRRLEAAAQGAESDPLHILDWVNLYALAVNEENAAGGRVVTAPTNGAAGIIPAVAHYYDRFTDNATSEGIVRFLLTAGAIGILYKENASISGAEVGCQGEVGVACSMAAGGLVEALGGTPAQVENAAEIGMEHNLGLTCDPVGGRVQIPCIERNAMGSVKAINAARMAMQGDGQHHVSLDKVIATMRQTGLDMSNRYKETSRGGLALNIIEC